MRPATARSLEQASLPAPGIRLPAWTAALALTVVGALAGGIVAWLLLSPRSHRTSGALDKAWGPLLHPHAQVTLCVATPPQPFMRPVPGRELPLGINTDAGPLLQEWFRKEHPGSLYGRLAMVPTSNSPLWGDAAGALVFARVLAQRGVESRLLAERLARSPALSGADIVLFGTPEYSPAATKALEGLPLQTGFDAATNDFIVWRQNERGEVVRRWPPQRDGHDRLKLVYGLVTVMPEPSNDRFRKIVVGGISSAGALAAAEYFASEKHLTDLLSRLGGRWPPVAQIIVRARTERTIALDWAYEMHVAQESPGSFLRP